MHYIAYALGSMGILMCIRMKTPYSYSTSLDGWQCYPVAKGAATEPRASCVLQPHDCHRERARYLGYEKATRHSDPSCPWLPLQSLTRHTGNRVVLTCIMSTIPHERVPSVFTSICITSTLKSITLSKQWVDKTPNLWNK
jgi:hypothetical protein